MESYFDIIPDDIIHVLISKLKSKQDIVSIKSAYINIYELLLNVNVWYVLIRNTYSKIFDTIKSESIDNIDQLEMIYYLSIEDIKLVNVYMEIKDIKLNEVGYVNKNKFVNWDQIYNHLIVNKNSKLFVKDSKIDPVVSNDENITNFLNMVTLIVYAINYDDKTQGPTIGTLLYAYQLNYNAYIFLYQLYDMEKYPRRIRDLLDIIDIDYERQISIILAKLNIYGDQITLNAIHSMLSDMEKRYARYNK